MKAVIFAGGVGTRLWPLSRKKSPKQFEKIIGEKSTLQIAVHRLMPDFKPEDIYVSTGDAYVELVRQQLDFIPEENVVGEPEMKDVGPAVSFMMSYLAQNFPDEPVAIIWSDHLVKEEEKFKQILQAAGTVISQDGEKIVFIGQLPRFASENLGWIETGEAVLNQGSFEFRKLESIKYRPDKAVAEQYFQDKKYCWNLGYFVTTPRFLNSLFQAFAPEIHALTTQIMSSIKSPSFKEQFKKYYSQMPKINFDNAVLEHIDKSCGYVVIEDIGWSDVGAWEALKEALEKSKEDTITKGRVILEGSKDSLVYNYDEKKLIVGIDVEDILIVNTDDVLLVAKKSSVSKVKKMVEGFQGTEHEGLT